MVISKTGTIYEFLRTVQSLGFFGRIFSWNRVARLGPAAAVEVDIMVAELGETAARLAEATSRVLSQEQEIERLNAGLADQDRRYQVLATKHESAIRDLAERDRLLGRLGESEARNTLVIRELEERLAVREYEGVRMAEENRSREKELSALEQAESERHARYGEKITELNTLTRRLDEDRQRVQDERDEEVRRRLEAIRETWRDHEKTVEQQIRSICARHQLEYIPREKVPFRGRPDNTLKICDEYVIFDAKSPASDDLSNFAFYLRNQAGAMKKYAGEPGVHRRIFLVIPSNTADIVTTYFYDLADYQVFAVTIDALEPIILALRRIEDYEFAGQLSPVERDDICRILGKFAHATKRRLQVDSYFSGEFIGLLQACGSLPEDISRAAAEYEKACKLNPPVEQRAKQIPLYQLIQESERDRRTQEALGILPSDIPGNGTSGRED